MLLDIPVPTVNLEIVWLLIGMSFARSFGKKLDWSIQQSTFFNDRGSIGKWILGRIMDFTHHWWMGAIMWLYAPLIVKTFFWPTLLQEVYWFGVGIFIDDLRDFKHVLARYKTETEEQPPDG